MRYYPGICLEGLRKATKTSVRTASDLTKILIKYLPNRSLQYYGIPTCFLFIYGLFNVVSSSENMMSNGKMVSENGLERMWKEAAMAKFYVLCYHLPRRMRKTTRNLSQNS
jgi:hypothetical protein